MKFSNAEIRSAMMKAADHVETNPQQYNYHQLGVPTNKGKGIGCALGWTGHFLGVSTQSLDWGVAPAIGVPRSGQDNPGLVFYLRMNRLNQRWTGNALECASTLRLYADKYHKEET